jgi:uncharacterized protein YukE
MGLSDCLRLQGLPVSEILVEPDDLRSGAEKVKTNAPKMTAMTSKVDRGAGEADKSNRGYLTGEAAQQFSERFDEAMRSAQDSIEDQAGRVKDVAQAWQDADTAIAKSFDAIASQLSR